MCSINDRCNICRETIHGNMEHIQGVNLKTKTVILTNADDTDLLLALRKPANHSRQGGKKGGKNGCHYTLAKLHGSLQKKNKKNKFQ